MAADSLTNVYDRPIIDGARKIRRLQVGEHGEALLAVSGDGGLADLAEFNLNLTKAPSTDEDSDEDREFAFEVACSLSELAKDAGLVDDGRLDGNALLGWNGKIWTLTHAQAIPAPDGRAAVGSGEGPAMGALDVLLDIVGAEPAQAVMEAVKVAIHRDRNSAAPFYVEVLR